MAFLEAPRWRDDGLYCSDQHGHQVMRIDAEGNVEVLADVPHCPSGLGWLPDDRMLVVSMEDRKLMHIDGANLALFADLSALAPFEINDMVVDRAGHAFIGQFGFDVHGGGKFASAPLLRVDPDGSTHIAAEDVSCANGMIVTEDESTLIVAESGASKLTAFDLAGDGALSNRRVWAELPTAPDGICLDSENAVWVACPVGDKFIRVHEGGRVSEEIPVPERHSIACALGGEDGQTLFMLTSETLGNPQESAERRASKVETTRVPVRGCARP